MLFLLVAAVYVGNSVCADCHRNIVRRYADTKMGRTVACERCHGPGSLHAQGSARLIVPPALEPAARDSVCAQCHLKGFIQVNRQGRALDQFRPGDQLARFVATFVHEPESGPAGYAESLAASLCNRKSGGALWCGSCHDVHDGAILDKAAARKTCLQCHATRNCGKGDECIACHMPVRSGKPARTNHAIPRMPGPDPPAVPSWKLRPFTAADGGQRELGLAYAALFRRTGDRRYAEEADRILKTVKPPDGEVRKWLTRATKAK